MDSDVAGRLQALTLVRKPAETALNSGRHAEAKTLFLNLLKELVRDRIAVPLSLTHHDGAVKNKVYMELSISQKICFMNCCIGVAQCLRKANEVEQALYWLEEVNVVYLNVLYSLKEPLWDWNWDLDYSPEAPEMTLAFVKSRCLASDISIALGNTGTAVWQRFSTNYERSPNMTPEAWRILDKAKMDRILQLRHPDPAKTAQLKVTVPSLQVLGSWKKLDARKMNNLMQRMSFSSFIWKGHLYVAGGRKDSLGPFYRDIWRLNLDKLGSWIQLPDYPVPMSQSGAFLNWTMIPYQDKAYLFTGRPDVDVFDLVTEKWSSFRTTYTPTAIDRRKGGVEGKWMYPGFTSQDSTQQIVDGKLYVFGGTHGKTNIGCSLFMVLDLQTRQWTRLSGTVMALKPDLSCPGPRKTPASWVNGTNERIYIFSGECARNGAYLQKEPHGAADGYAFADLWSWSIKEARWRRERMVGNIPCPRSEVAFTWNPKLGKAIIWGGYHPNVPTNIDSSQFGFTYYADTFVFEPSCPQPSPLAATVDQPKWRQVITRGFPTYRCQAQLIADPETGKTYLFGGFTNTQYVPERKDCISRSFGDLWQLRLDVPGGYFEDADIQEEARTAKQGPWRRCFACGSAGSWKKCGGSCKGRAFFCDPECYREGWKEHKEMHDCKKV